MDIKYVWTAERLYEEEDDRHFGFFASKEAAQEVLDRIPKTHREGEEDFVNRREVLVKEDGCVFLLQPITVYGSKEEYDTRTRNR